MADHLAAIGWRNAELGRQLNIGEVTIRAWMSGRREPPPAVLAWLRAIRAAIEAGPEGWRR
jgi:DNA-binding transcriptional regulator YiaG